MCAKAIHVEYLKTWAQWLIYKEQINEIQSIIIISTQANHIRLSCYHNNNNGKRDIRAYE